MRVFLTEGYFFCTIRISCPYQAVKFTQQLQSFGNPGCVRKLSQLSGKVKYYLWLFESFRSWLCQRRKQTRKKQSIEMSNFTQSNTLTCTYFLHVLNVLTAKQDAQQFEKTPADTDSHQDQGYLYNIGHNDEDAIHVSQVHVQISSCPGHTYIMSVPCVM